MAELWDNTMRRAKAAQKPAKIDAEATPGEQPVTPRVPTLADMRFMQMIIDQDAMRAQLIRRGHLSAQQPTLTVRHERPQFRL